jgi:N-acetyltransferase
LKILENEPLAVLETQFQCCLGRCLPSSKRRRNFGHLALKIFFPTSGRVSQLSQLSDASKSRTSQHFLSHHDATLSKIMIKRKYGARNALPLQETHTSVKRQRIQDAATSDPVQTSAQPSRSSTPKTALEAWLKPTRVAATQSSSPRLEPGTPPSSPPPGASQSEPESPQLLKIQKPAFSFLRRPRLTPVPLSDSISGANAQITKTQNLARDKQLTQLTIDLGGPTTISCPECGMSYTPSQIDDAVLHTKHHASHLAKLNISLEGWKLIKDRACWKDMGTGENIVAVSEGDKVLLKNLVERVLAIASQDLGAVEIPRAQLWSKVAERERYRIFLFCKDRKCIGLVLAEHISSAFEVKSANVLQTQQSTSSAPLEFASKPTSAKLGISRIWTLRTARRSGIAFKLLEATRRSFVKHSHIEKSSIAFSQPTEMGTALARKWFGKEHGWLVYRD